MSCKDAKKYLTSGKKWIQGTYGRDGGPRCLLGAARFPTAPSSKSLVLELLGAACEAVAPGVTSELGRPRIAPWNDHPNRTFEEVKAAAKLAAWLEERL
jgi:hypothetical protein